MDHRSPRGEDDSRVRPDSSANLAALAVVLVLAILGYWVFSALEHSRRYQRCLDAGQRNCIDFADR